jgi:diacylglycerol kinase family enzyme
VLGEKTKDGAFGSLARELGAVVRAEPFDFTTRGAFAAHGRTRSLVFTNTPATGSRLPVGSAAPTDPFLELNINVGGSRSDIVGRLVASVLGNRHADGEGASFQFRSLTISTRPRAAVVADNERAGRTPVTVESVPGALRIFVPQ